MVSDRKRTNEVHLLFGLVTAQDLWKTITSVSNAGAKRGRAKRRGATKFKDLNMGQRIGQGSYSCFSRASLQHFRA
jgi:hypothetical protein